MTARWDQFFLRLARECANMSKDPSTQVGAVLARNREVVSMGFNGFPPGVEDDDRLHSREAKYPLVVHAEMNALLRARDARGCALYIWRLLPCSQCAKHVVAAGVCEVVVPSLDVPSRWRQDVDLSIALFREAGVPVRSAALSQDETE